MPRPNDPMTISTADATCIAYASSERDGRDRWTVLQVFVLPDGRYLAQAEGMSQVPGERTKTRRLASRHLNRALKLFDDSSDIGVSVREAAFEWEEDAGRAMQAATKRLTNQEALTLLYGEAPTGRKGYSGLVATDFGAGESTVRAAIANGTAIKVPLAAVVPFLDRALLAQVRAAQE